jgi:hypothetical protein
MLATKQALICAATDAEKEGWIRNYWLIAVATHAQTHDGAYALFDLRPLLMIDIKELFSLTATCAIVSLRQRDEAGFRPGPHARRGRYEDLREAQET